MWAGWLTEKFNEIIRIGAESRTGDIEFIRKETDRFLNSRRCHDMIKGDRYYKGLHDILFRKRTAIGEGGEPMELENLPNDRLVNNQYAKMVDQKVNYLLGKEIVFNTENEVYSELLNNEVLGEDFDRLMVEVGEDCLNCGIGWIYAGYDDSGGLKLRRMKPWQVIPLWADDEHTVLDCVIRIYPVIMYEGKEEKQKFKIEVYDRKGITKLEKEGANIYPDGANWKVPYFYAEDSPVGWDRIPFVAFRANRGEQPLLNKVKSLQDALNLMMSIFSNNMQEDARNTILVIKNYDGENLGEFRRNLATYGAVKVRSADGSGGGVDTLQIEVNSENYKAITELLKKAIIENAMGYDAKDDRLGGNANQLNIRSMYSDIDLDANKMESEFQAALRKLLWFINAYLSHTGKGDFEGERIDIIFNRDILINESETIDNLVKSAGILSDETLVAQHPYVDDVKAELERIEKQKEKEQQELKEQTGGTYGGRPSGTENGGGTE